MNACRQVILATTVISLLAGVAGCNSTTDRREAWRFKITGHRGEFIGSYVTRWRKCTFLECGESSEKILGDWFEFIYTEDNRVVKRYPLIDVLKARGAIPGIRFEFCGDRFVPIDGADESTIEGVAASKLRCRSGIETVSAPTKSAD